MKRGIVGLGAVVSAVLVLAACTRVETVPVSAASRPAASTTAVASASTAPAPAPVSSTARLSGHCVTGFVTLDPETNQPTDFSEFPGSTAYPSGTEVQGGYQLTLTDTSSVTAEVGSFSVVFYSHGAEIGSDSAGPFNEFITQGQSLTWTEATNVMNVGSEGAVNTAATCALVSWSS